MRALSLWQPWATLVAAGAKRVETRSWPVPGALVGERIAIHAAKRRSVEAIRLSLEEPFTRALADAGCGVGGIDRPEVTWQKIPLGVVVATCVVDRCAEITAQAAEALADRHPDEFAFGNYELGRFAWVLRDVVRLPDPVPFRGGQRIFEVPDQLLGVEPPQGALL